MEEEEEEEEEEKEKEEKEEKEEEDEEEEEEEDDDEGEDNVEGKLEEIRSVGGFRRNFGRDGVEERGEDVDEG